MSDSRVVSLWRCQLTADSLLNGSAFILAPREACKSEPMRKTSSGVANSGAERCCHARGQSVDRGTYYYRPCAGSSRIEDRRCNGRSSNHPFAASRVRVSLPAIEIEMTMVFVQVGGGRWMVCTEVGRDHLPGLIAGQRRQYRAPGCPCRQRERLVDLDDISESLRAVDSVLKHHLVCMAYRKIAGFAEPVRERLQHWSGRAPERISLSDCGCDAKQLGPDGVHAAFINFFHPPDTFELVEDPADGRTIDTRDTGSLSWANTAIRASDKR